VLKLNAAGKSEFQYYLGLGSNIEPGVNLPQSIDLLRQHVIVNAFSTVWETPAEGRAGPNFLNAVVWIQSDLPPDELKSQVIRPIEARLGRVRTSDKNAPRPIDIDILLVNGIINTDDVWNYAHLAVPLAELLPNLIYPSTGKTLATIADRFRQSTKIFPCFDISLGARA
jgi:2-amino-4-hydroxy-6-hydroxymethyldihydropteridine diphosphokinase